MGSSQSRELLWETESIGHARASQDAGQQATTERGESGTGVSYRLPYSPELTQELEPELASIRQRQLSDNESVAPVAEASESSEPRRDKRKAENKDPATPPPRHRSKRLASKSSVPAPPQQAPPAKKRRAETTPAENEALTTPLPPPSAGGNGQEIHLIPGTSENELRTRGQEPLYARRGPHRGSPRPNTPRVNEGQARNTGVSGPSGPFSAGAPDGVPPGGGSAKEGSSPGGSSAPSDPPSPIRTTSHPRHLNSTESSVSKDAAEGSEDLTDPGFLLSIVNERADIFCVRLRGEGEPLRQGWHVLNFLSVRGNFRALRRGLVNAIDDEDVSEYVASMSANTVLTRIANSRPGRPLIYTDAYDEAPYLNVAWAYHISLRTETLTVYGPPGQNQGEAALDNFYYHALDPGRDGGRIPRRIIQYTSQQLSEFDSPQAFQQSVFSALGERATDRYGSPSPRQMGALNNPTELDDTHGDPRSPSVKTASTEHGILSSPGSPQGTPPRPDSTRTRDSLSTTPGGSGMPSSDQGPGGWVPEPSDAVQGFEEAAGGSNSQQPPGAENVDSSDGSQPRLGSPIQFRNLSPRCRPAQDRIPTPGPGCPPLLYSTSSSGPPAEPGERPRATPTWHSQPQPHQPPPPNPGSGDVAKPSTQSPFHEGTTFYAGYASWSPSMLPSPSPRRNRPSAPEPPRSPENRPTYNRHGSPWEPGDSPPPEDHPSLDYGQYRNDSDSTVIEGQNRPPGIPRGPIAYREPSQLSSRVILRLPTDENSPPVRGPPQPLGPSTPPWYMWRSPPEHPSRSFSPMDVSREPRGDDDGSPTLNVMAAPGRTPGALRCNATPELPFLRRSPFMGPDLRPEEPAESGVSDKGSDIYDSCPRRRHEGLAQSDPRLGDSGLYHASLIRTGPRFKRRRQEEAESDRPDGEFTSEESSPSVKKQRPNDGGESAKSGGQPKSGHPNDGPDLPDYESDPGMPWPNTTGLRNMITEDDLPDLDPNPGASSQFANMERRDSIGGGNGNGRGGGAYAYHRGHSRAGDFLDRLALNHSEAQRAVDFQINNQVIPAPARENEQINFRSPRWDRSSSNRTNDETSPKTRCNSQQAFTQSPEDVLSEPPATGPAQGLDHVVNRPPIDWDEDTDHLWRRSWPGGVRGGPTSDNMYQAAPEGFEEYGNEDEGNGRSGSWPGAKRARFRPEGYEPTYTYEDELYDPEGGEEGYELYEEGSSAFISLGSTPPSDWDVTEELSRESHLRNGSGIGSTLMTGSSSYSSQEF
ncbi:hypothetical protein VUR80DRAFT_415 [Thermomyces stellatus]